MNKIFESIQIWKMVLLIIVANLLNYIIALGLKSVFDFSDGVGLEVVRALMFAIQILWFYVIFAKNKVSIKGELRQLKNDINIREFTAVIIFNYALSIGMVLTLLFVVTKLAPTDVLASIMEGAEVPTEFTSALIGLITASILAPIAEELLFRGVLLTRMKRKIGVTAAVLLSSALFGMTHLSVSMLHAGIFGICMCILYLKTKNILVPIVFHMIYNFLLTVVGSYEVLFGIQASAETALVLHTATTLIQVVACMIVMIISGIYLSKKFRSFNLKPYKNSIKKEGLSKC